ncbi:MAG: 4Fe-4S cluster-binding domain-containing protein [candidate division Zixibacteria bacterium]|nr:4Fe-4S cluster-binding domain-containing protein [candidate division Zixibacteria bacterium]
MNTSSQSNHHDSNLNWQELTKPLEELKDCTVCPRECHANRTTDNLGFCQSTADFPVASISVHKGEEPPISGKNGICNIFFSHCNMQCIYCQNHQISDNASPLPYKKNDLMGIIQKIDNILERGIHTVGFVSASHFIPQMRIIIDVLKTRKHDVVFVFNTNSYDKKETIQKFDGVMNVYLPDLKYMDDDLAKRYSNTPNYTQIATTAIKEMFRQKGTEIKFGAEGNIQSGLIIRHLVLPGEVENSKKALRFIVKELSTSIHISLMAQYYPTPKVKNHPYLGRTLKPEEYEEVLEEFERLGFHRGWTQKLDSSDHYRPDFSSEHPFKNN